MITFTVIRNDKFIYHNVWSIIVKVNSKHIILYVIKKSTVVYMGIICHFVFWGMGGRGGGMIQVTIEKLLECQNFIKT